MDARAAREPVRPARGSHHPGRLSGASRGDSVLARRRSARPRAAALASAGIRDHAAELCGHREPIPLRAVGARNLRACRGHVLSRRHGVGAGDGGAVARRGVAPAARANVAGGRGGRVRALARPGDAGVPGAVRGVAAASRAAGPLTVRVSVPVRDRAASRRRATAVDPARTAARVAGRWADRAGDTRDAARSSSPRASSGDRAGLWRDRGGDRAECRRRDAVPSARQGHPQRRLRARLDGALEAAAERVQWIHSPFLPPARGATAGIPRSTFAS